MHRTAYILSFTSLLGALAGCGSVVTEDTTSSSSGDTGGGGDGGSSAVSSGVTTTGGSGGACSEPNDSLAIDLVTADGTAFGCSVPQTEGSIEDFVLQGQIHMIAPGVAGLDTCPPNADCGPSLATFSVKAEGFVLSLPEGAYVEVRMRVAAPMACGARILVTNLATWGGVPNPVPSLDPLLLAASDGLADTFSEAPFGVDKVSVCTMGPAGGAEAFSFRFFSAGDPPGTGVVVPQGGNVIWAAPFQKHGPVMVRNLRSFDSGFADENSNWSYLMAPALVGE
jgi:hypothetical protein